MSIDYTTTSLIKAIKRKGSIPTNQQLYSDTDFVDTANDEMECNIVPLLMRVREEYFVTYKDYVINNESKFDIPFDAVGMKLRQVAIVVNVGSPTEQIVDIPRLELETIAANNSIYTLDTINNLVTGFYFQGNQVCLYPAQNGYSQSGVLRLYYIKRPLKLTTVTNCGYIKAINTGTKEIQLSSVPADWEVGTVLNAVSQTPGFKTTNSQMVITAISSPTITVDTIEGLTLNDYVSVQGYSCIPQLPVEAIPVLAQASVVKVLESLGDREGMKIAQAKMDENKKDMLTLISPRSDGNVKKINNMGRGFIG